MEDASDYLVSNIHLCLVQEVDELINNGARVNAIDHERNTPLHNIFKLSSKSFFRNDQIAIVCKLLRHGADVNARNIHWKTPLHMMLSSNFCYWVQLLLNAGADANSKTKCSVTPLHTALIHCAPVDVIRQLLACGADVNAVDSNGVSPLMCSQAYEASPEIVKLLVKQGARFRLNEIGSFYHGTLNPEISSLNKCLIKYNEAFGGLYGKKSSKAYAELVSHNIDDKNRRVLERYRKSCVAEIKRMRLRMLSDKISVRNFFFGPTLQHPTLHTPGVCDRAYDVYERRQFPIYGDLITQMVMESSKSIWIDIIYQQQIHSVDVQSGRKICLNAYCLKAISEYLSVYDMFSLAAAWDSSNNTLPSAGTKCTRNNSSGRKRRRTR